MYKSFSESIMTPFAISHLCTMKNSEQLVHVHENGFELLLFIDGKANFICETSIYDLKPGDLLLVPPGVPHGYRTYEGINYERIPLHVQKNLFFSLSKDETPLHEVFINPEHRILHLDVQEMELYISYADTIINLEKNALFGHGILSRSYLLVLFLLVRKSYKNSFSSSKSTSPKIIQDALDYISQHLTDCLTVQSIASELGLSCSRLSHLFKEYTGSSVWNYVLIQRLLLSRSMLQKGKTVMEACFESGFQDYSHFSRLFSKTFNMTPGKYIKAYEREKSGI